jgi:tetrahydromethanopterin S-methyltransferase subunit D
VAFKIAAGIVAAALLIIFIGPVVVKLKDAALGAVVLIGLTMMIIDLWQSFKSKDD